MKINLVDLNNIAIAINNALYDINLRDLNKDFGEDINVNVKLDNENFNEIDRTLNNELNVYDKDEKCNDMNINIHNINFHIINKKEVKENK